MWGAAAPALRNLSGFLIFSVQWAAGESACAIMNRYRLITLMAAFCALLSAQPPASAQDLRRIHYGTSISISHLPVWVAKDAGLFAKKGLKFRPGQTRGGALLTSG